MLTWKKMQDKKILTLPQKKKKKKICLVLYSKRNTVRLLTFVEEWIFLDEYLHKLDISYSQTLSL